MQSDIYQGSLSLLGILIAILTALKADIANIGSTFFKAMGGTDQSIGYYLYLIAFITFLCSLLAFLTFCSKFTASWPMISGFEKGISFGFTAVLFVTTLYPVIVLLV